MQKRNKIISKRLLPATVIAGIAIPFLFAVLFNTTFNETKDAPKEDKALSFSLSVLFAIFGACFLAIPIADAYSSDYEFASHVAREYLKKEIQEHPELKTFEKVLHNPRALRSVATMISNHLRPSEQKLVMKAIDEMISTKTRTTAEKIAITKQAHAKIVKIIQEHASVYPEFIDEVLVAMAHADTIYVMPAQQRVR